jgi:hypothetical protein
VFDDTAAWKEDSGGFEDETPGHTLLWPTRKRDDLEGGPTNKTRPALHSDKILFARRCNRRLMLNDDADKIKVASDAGFVL